MTLREGGPLTFSLRRVQAMLGLSRSVIDGLIAAGFVAPTRGRRNELRFTFQDLMLLRTAYALHASQIPPRKIVRALASLRSKLPQELPLTGLRITAIGGDVAVRDRAGRLETDSGQLLMDFDVATVDGGVAFLERDKTCVAANPAARDAAHWFQRGEDLEETDAAQAEAAYRQALALAPNHVNAYLNLGAMWCEAGRFAEVVDLYEQAVNHCPQSAEIHFNLAVALDSLERVPEAIASYEQSLKLDPTLADAHYNIARLQEQLGDARSALRHFSAYRRLQK